MSRLQFFRLLPMTTLTLLGILLGAPMINAADTEESATGTEQSDQESYQQENNNSDENPSDSDEESTVNTKNPEIICIQQSPITEESEKKEKGSSFWEKCTWQGVKKQLIKASVPTIIAIKTAFDVYQVYCIITQIQSGKDLTTILEGMDMKNCTGILCGNNAAGLREAVHKETIVNGISATASILSAIGSGGACIAYIKGEENGMVIAFGLGICFTISDVAKCFTNYIANGFLWTAGDKFLGGMPAVVKEAMQRTQLLGIPQMTLSTFTVLLEGTIAGRLCCCRDK